MPGWNDMGGMLNTLRELDVSAIEEEALRPLTVACIGGLEVVEQLAFWLRDATGQRRGPVGEGGLEVVTLPVRSPESLAQASLLLVALDGHAPPRPADRESLSRVAALGVPLVVAALGVTEAAEAAAERLALPPHMRVVPVADLESPEGRGLLATAVAEALPRELLIPAARRLPGLRSAAASLLIQTTSVANASYALAASLPQQIPILSIPFAAADILVLTKNQALMVYKLALAYGAPTNFPAHLREILPVVGGAYLWRQVARSLIGLIPAWGIVPKTVVAYAGTYATGVTAWRWYATGQLVSQEQLRELSREAMTRARLWVDEAMARAREQGGGLQSRARALLDRARRSLPGRRPPGT